MNAQQLNKILKELMVASMQLGPSPTNDEIKSLMHKYDMTFLGSKINVIYSLELLHSLKKHFNFELTNDELNSLIPECCKFLNMGYEPMAKVDDMSNPIPYCYQITLW